MSTSEHALEALQSLQRARRALDDLWRDCRQTAPSTAQLDSQVFNIAVELSGVHDSLEKVVERGLGVLIGSLECDAIEADPQAMTVDNWEDSNDA